MAAQMGNLNLAFAGKEEALEAVRACIREKIRERDQERAGREQEEWEDEIGGWDFLDDFDPASDKFSSELVGEETFEKVTELTHLLAKQAPNASFLGDVNLGWVMTEGPDTKLEFTYVAGGGRIWYSDGREAWVWNAQTGETEKTKAGQMEAGLLPRADVDLAFPLTLHAEKTNLAGRLKRIENIQKGDLLTLKADWNSKDYWPVQIEVCDRKGGSLGCLNVYEQDNTLVQLARELDSLLAVVKSVTPISKRAKNAKNALLEVEIRLKSSAAGSGLASRQKAGMDMEQARSLSKARSLKGLKDSRDLFPKTLSAYAIRKTRIGDLKAGAEVTMQADGKNRAIQLLNGKGEVFGTLSCGSFGYILDEEAEDLPREELFQRMLEGYEIVAGCMRELRATVERIGTNRQGKPTVDILVSWR